MAQAAGAARHRRPNGKACDLPEAETELPRRAPSPAYCNIIVSTRFPPRRVTTALLDNLHAHGVGCRLRKRPVISWRRVHYMGLVRMLACRRSAMASDVDYLKPRSRPAALAWLDMITRNREAVS